MQKADSDRTTDKSVRSSKPRLKHQGRLPKEGII